LCSIPDDLLGKEGKLLRKHMKHYRTSQKVIYKRFKKDPQKRLYLELSKDDLDLKTTLSVLKELGYRMKLELIEKAGTRS
jgi:hypothetical protein